MFCDVNLSVANCQLTITKGNGDRIVIDLPLSVVSFDRSGNFVKIDTASGKSFSIQSADGYNRPKEIYDFLAAEKALCPANGGGGGGSVSQSSERQFLCDDNGPFFQRETNDGAGVITQTNTTLAGAAYAPVGTVAKCSGMQVKELAGCLKTSYSSLGSVNGLLASLEAAGALDAGGGADLNINGTPAFASDLTTFTEAALITELNAGPFEGFLVVNGILVQNPLTALVAIDGLWNVSPGDDLGLDLSSGVVASYSDTESVKIIQIINPSQTGNSVQILNQQVFRLNGLTEVTFPLQINQSIDFDCDAGESVTTEIGFIADAAGVDMAGIDRCRIDGVVVDGETIAARLDAGWTIEEFVDEVNRVRPGTLVLQGNTVVGVAGKAFANIEIVCIETDFTETFGVGGADGARLATPNTNYTFKNAGNIFDGEYALTTFTDTGLAVWSNGNGTIDRDALGDTNGNALLVSADAAPGEFYRQGATLILGQEYRLSFYIINTQDPVVTGLIQPNVRYDVEELPGNAVLVTGESGDIPPPANLNEWTKVELDFIATRETVEFVLVNNAAGGAGNELAIDQIEFSRVKRTLVQLTPRGYYECVEIVKRLSSDGSVIEVRTFSPDGRIEYPLPDGQNRVLCTGAAITKPELITPNSSYIPSVQRVSAAGTISEGLQKWTITNDGNANGTVGGQILKPGESITFEAYFDRAEKVMRRPSQIQYDATGTDFLIVITP